MVSVCSIDSTVFLYISWVIMNYVKVRNLVFSLLKFSLVEEGCCVPCLDVLVL